MTEVLHHGATMLTRIDERANLIVTIAGDNHRLAPNERRHKIVWLGELAFVREIHPSPAEDIFHFQLEDLGVREHSAMDSVEPLLRSGIEHGLEGVDGDSHAVRPVR